VAQHLPHRDELGLAAGRLRVVVEEARDPAHGRRPSRARAFRPTRPRSIRRGGR
jgi:hypothetical protein